MKLFSEVYFHLLNCICSALVNLAVYVPKWFLQCMNGCHKINEPSSTCSVVLSGTYRELSWGQHWLHVRKMYVSDISRKKEFILMPCALYRLRSMVLVNRRSSVVCRVVLCDQCCKSVLDLSLWTPWTFWYLFFTQCICLSRSMCVLTPYKKKARKFNSHPHPPPSPFVL